MALSLGHALGMDAGPEATRLSNSRIREEIEVGGEVTSRGSSCSVKWRGTYIEEKRNLSRSLEGWGDFVMVKHTPVFTVN